MKAYGEKISKDQSSGLSLYENKKESKNLEVNPTTPKGNKTPKVVKVDLLSIPKGSKKSEMAQSSSGSSLNVEKNSLATKKKRKSSFLVNKAS
jgi:hypothetical protein